MTKMLHINGKPVTLENVQQRGNALSFTIDGVVYPFQIERNTQATWLVQETAPGVVLRMPMNRWASGKETARVQVGVLEAQVKEPSLNVAQSTQAQLLSPVAPMPGLVRQMLVEVGDVLEAGQPIAVMEAMKLQLTLAAGGDAVVEAVLVQVGDMVAEGAELVRLKAR